MPGERSGWDPPWWAMILWCAAILLFGLYCRALVVRFDAIDAALEQLQQPDSVEAPDA